MRNFQEKKNKRKLMHSKPVLIILSILVLLFIYNVIKLANKAADTKRNREIAENKIIELQKQKEDLTKQIEKLNTEKGIEEDIREKFGLGKEGEGMIVIVDDESKNNNESAEKSGGFWSFLKNLFNI
jgi:cell division protein FtsB